MPPYFVGAVCQSASGRSAQYNINPRWADAATRYRFVWSSEQSSAITPGVWVHPDEEQGSRKDSDHLTKSTKGQCLSGLVLRAAIIDEHS
jgi:hypothetical protein